MEIFINGELREVPDTTSVPELLALLDLSGRRLALEINCEIVPRTHYANQRLQPGDHVEIVQAIGGG
jgi:sulfur carrier protein